MSDYDKVKNTRLKCEALEALKDAEQIKAWINGFAEQKEFWEVVVHNGTWANLNKTEKEAEHLISYYEGRYDTALLFRDFVAQKTIES